jgi:hypothetical protein
MPLDLLWLAVPAYVILQVLALAWSTGRARLVAGAPLIVMAPIFVLSVVGLLQGSNLWPLPLLFASPPAMLYAGVAALIAKSGARPVAH